MQIAKSVKPYYKAGGITLYHADCRELLPTFGTETVDLVLTDPPYGVAWSGTLRRKSSPLGVIVGDDGSLDVPAVLSQALRVLKRNRHLYAFGQHDLTGLKVGGIAELIWDKVIPGPAGPAPWQYQHEYITFTSRVYIPSCRTRGDGNGAARLRRGTILRFRRANGLGAQRHPTEKPVPLLRELIESSSRMGEVVLDPFVGCGSTLHAAVLEGRQSIGIEIEERYCEIAARRIEAVLVKVA